MASQANSALPDGSVIGGYRILRKISSGGFSIVYLARDEHERLFAIKEYLPARLVSRAPGERSPTVAPEHLSVYRHGLKAFFEEGRALARIPHPNIVRVVNFFRENGTVYLVMAYERGLSLQEHILRNRGRQDRAVLSERHLRAIFDRVLQGLREVHANRLLHLDLKPANVYLRRDGTPLLLDFGAARQALGEDAPRLFPMFTPGFAAPELQRPGEALGPWTDLYGVGATMFACMLGLAPPSSKERADGDRVPEMLDTLDGVYSRPLLEIVRNCLALTPLDRPQSVFSVQRSLRGPGTPSRPLPASGLAGWFGALSSRLHGRSRGKPRDADSADGGDAA
jgi:serine/threonine protein kinase